MTNFSRKPTRAEQLVISYRSLSARFVGTATVDAETGAVVRFFLPSHGELVGNRAQRSYDLAERAVALGNMTAEQGEPRVVRDAGAVACACGRSVELEGADYDNGAQCHCGATYSPTGQLWRADWKQIAIENGERPCYPGDFDN